MIYCEAAPYQNGTDKSVHRTFRGRKHIHLCADSEEELVGYAVSALAMKPEWLQRGRVTHFDVTGWRMERALLDARVEKLTRKELVERWRLARKDGE